MLQALADEVGKLFSIDSLEIDPFRTIESQIVGIVSMLPVS